MMDNLGFMLTFAAVGTVGFFWGFTRLKRARIIQDIPTSTIRSAAMGFLELTGKAKPLKKNLLSPLTSTECVWYKFIVQEYRQRGKSGSWYTIAKADSSNIPFWIEDNTGRILVLPKNAEFILPKNYHFCNNFRQTIPQNLIHFMDKYGLSYRSWLGFNKTLDFKEFVIRPKDTVYVLGSVEATNYLPNENISNSNNSINEKLINRLRQLKEDKEKLKQFDINQDGQIDYEEWQLAVNKIEQELSQEQLNNSLDNNSTTLVIKQGKQNKLFIISNYSQKRLIKSLTWQGIGAIIGGAIAATIGFYLLLTTFFFK